MQIEAPNRLRGRLQRLGSALRAPAVADTAGWSVVAVLTILALATTAMVLRPSRGRPPSEAAPDVHLISTPPATADDPVNFTVSPVAVQAFSHAQARIWNRALPYSADPVRPAAALIAPASDIEAYGRALDCLTAAVYYEAGSEPAQGQAAVAQVVLNRTRHPAYPRSVCGVVFQGSERLTGCQFSFTCDGAMARAPSPAGWARARSVASAALNGAVVPEVGTATHFHTDWVAPYWAPRLSKIVAIGAHIFYRWKGVWGLPSAFTRAYPGLEPVVARMVALSTIAAAHPAEIVLATEPMLAAPAPFVDPAPRPPAPLAEDRAEAQAPPAEWSAVALAAPEPIVPVAHRDAPVMADPMISPSALPGPRRQRIAAPSGW